MSIDVQTETVIGRPRSVVAGFGTNADNDPAWIGGITQPRTLTEPLRALYGSFGPFNAGR